MVFIENQRILSIIEGGGKIAPVYHVYGQSEMQIKCTKRASIYWGSDKKSTSSQMTFCYFYSAQHCTCMC